MYLRYVGQVRLQEGMPPLPNLNVLHDSNIVLTNTVQFGHVHVIAPLVTSCVLAGIWH
jgi:hypothetical protein